MEARTAGLRDVVVVLAAWTVILLAVLGAGWLITHAWAARVDPWDNDAARWFAGHRDAELTDAAEAGTWLGETRIGVAVATVVAAAVALWRRSVRPALFVALVVAGTGGFYGLATVLISRPRPPVRILDPGLVPDDSYPSGHVGTAVAVYGATAVLLWWYAGRTRRWGLLLALVPLVVALSRLYLGAHHVTDVLASMCYTTLWLGVVARVLHRRWAPDGDRPRAAGEPAARRTDGAGEPPGGSSAA